MASRRRVPEALHSEISKHAALMRALNTNEILDLTSQLIQHESQRKKVSKPAKGLESPASSNLNNLIPFDDDAASSERLKNKEYDSESEYCDMDDSDYRATPPPFSSQPSAPGTLKRKRSLDSRSTTSHSEIPDPSQATATSKGKSRAESSDKGDTWTRWPLKREDLPTPLWGMQDEVEALVGTFLRQSEAAGSYLHLARVNKKRLASSRASEDGDEEDESDEIASETLSDLDTPSFISELTTTTTHVVRKVLDTLADVTPARAPSLQNRLNPLGWEDVLEAFALSGAMDPEATQRFVDA